MNRLTIAVAGGRKTQGIVDACASAGNEKRIAVLAYTQSSQAELTRRISERAGLNPNVEVIGWYAFLLRHFVRPYLPLLYRGRVLSGLNYEGDPGRMIAGAARYLDRNGGAYQINLADLAHKVYEASDGSVLDRLERIYTDIYVDEAQDIGGWALEILDVLFGSKIHLHLVGDMRQALLSTDSRAQKNSQYRGEAVLRWYRQAEKRGALEIVQQNETYRSSQEIARFSDSVFSADAGYATTVSRASESADHAGLLRVAPRNVDAYMEAHAPMCLRWSAAMGKAFDLPYLTFGKAKGLTADHVLIVPTKAMKDFLALGKQLEGMAACSLYVGATRAVHSVAFVLDNSDVANQLTEWKPAR